MPIYEYECRGCGHQFEFLLLPTNVPACPSCGGSDLQRAISMFAVSSDGTRQQALSDARKRAAGVKREKDHAEMEYIKNHPHD
jgi:putative FmdB family regulatory protein